MKYKYRMFYKLSPQSERPPDGWFIIKRKRKGFLGIFDMWSYYTLGITAEVALSKLEQKLKDTSYDESLVKEWADA